MSELKFPDEFLWGTATASYQIEGAHNKDGRGESIWDRFAHTPGNIEDDYTGDIACDHYNRYQEDVVHMKEMGLDSYRFSIAWPRVMPYGEGKVNHRGLDFYKKLVYELRKNDIVPMATLYHWDLPQTLQFQGGWANNDTVKYYQEYVNLLLRELGDDVPYWITFNEPWCISFLSNQIGEHAPGNKDYITALEVAHNLHVAHGLGVDAFRAENLASQVGIVLNLFPVEPESDSEEDRLAAELMDSYKNRWFLDPVFRGEYPEKLYDIYRDQVGDFERGHQDISTACREIDFLGINYYTRNVVKYNKDSIIRAEQINPPENDYTCMGWEICPDGLYRLLKRVDADYGPIPLFITENGAAYDDEREESGIHDQKRIDYLDSHFRAALRALKEGVPLKGYYIWTLMDNFEWAFGYNRRFGLIYTDYQNGLERVWKDSAYWLRKMLGKKG
ncbi:MAG: GH1 family beta-glucosidase [Halanaerobiaceae bacterium]